MCTSQVRRERYRVPQVSRNVATRNPLSAIQTRPRSFFFFLSFFFIFFNNFLVIVCSILIVDDARTAFSGPLWPPPGVYCSELLLLPTGVSVLKPRIPTCPHVNEKNVKITNASTTNASNFIRDTEFTAANDFNVQYLHGTTLNKLLVECSIGLYLQDKKCHEF